MKCSFLSRPLFLLYIGACLASVGVAQTAPTDSVKPNAPKAACCSGATRADSARRADMPNKAWASRWSKWRQQRRNRFYCGNVTLGFVKAAGAPAPYANDLGASLEVGFEPLQYRRYLGANRRSHVSLGLDFLWRNYRLTGRTRYELAPDGALVVQPYPEAATETASSRLKTFSVGFPLRYNVWLGAGWSASLGATLRLTPYASLRSEWREDDADLLPGEVVRHKVVAFHKGLHQQKVTVDLQAGLHWRSVGAYVRYNPCRVINADFAPSFSSLSFGLMLGL